MSTMRMAAIQAALLIAVSCGWGTMLTYGAGAPPGRVFYVDPAGDDTRSGDSPTKAWRTLNRVAKVDFQPGDRLLLKGGATFTGSIALDDADAGTPEKPVVLSSYGKGRATILSPGQTAISATTGGIEIRNLVLRGKGIPKTKKSDETKPKDAGIAFNAGKNAKTEHRHIRIADVDISGFGKAGIFIGAELKNPTGFSDVRISHVTANDNIGNGITTEDDSNDRTHGYAHHDLLITDCVTSRNISGSGIVISGFDRGVIEYCRASDNTGAGGAVGIWGWGAKSLVFRYCIANGTRTGGGDGGGFDLDGSCDGCIIENCLAYDNDGPGYMHCDYPWASRTIGNIIRNSISINDGHKGKGANVGFGYVTWGAGIDDCSIVNNLTIVTKGEAPRQDNAAFFVAYILGSEVKGRETPHVRGCTFENNVAIISDPGVAFVRNELPEPTVSDVRFTGNRYHAPEGVQPAFLDGKGGKQKYDSFEAWRLATGQETANGRSVASTDKPALPEVTQDNYKVTNPRQLSQFSMMKTLPPPSAKIGK